MRVVAGEARGLRLVAPRGESVRPTTDRVREATFNALGSLGAIEDARVLDLFAGSGALGIEALSRGARHCTFVDADADAIAVVRENLGTTGLDQRATVRHARARSVLDDSAAMSPEVKEFDLVLADPPYDFDGWGELLAELRCGIVVIESDRSVEPPAGWSVLRQRSYGATVVTIAERQQDFAGAHEDVSRGE